MTQKDPPQEKWIQEKWIQEKPIQDKCIQNPHIEPLDILSSEKLGFNQFSKAEKQLKKAKGLQEMLAAITSFQKAIELDPGLTCAYLSCGSAYLQVGILETNEEMITLACKQFEKAESLLANLNQKVPVDKLWDWGICHYFLAKISEEAIDLKYSVDKFRQAFSQGYQNPDFLLDFGTTLGQLGVTVGSGDLVQEATNILELCLKEQGENAKAWLRLACTYKILYQTLGDVVYFEKADQSFLAAARFDEGSMSLWFNWGQLLLTEGKVSHDESILYAAREKFEKADQIKEGDPWVLTFLADILIHLGAIEERIEFLQMAQMHLKQVMEGTKDHFEANFLYGLNLIQIGKYFSDSSYVEQAIEHVQKLLLKKEVVSHEWPLSRLWHGLATAHFALAEIKQDAPSYESACKCYAEAIRHQVDNPAFWNDWGVALMKWGDLKNDGKLIALAVEKYEEAIKTAHRINKGNPDPEWVYNYGCALDFLGEYEQEPSFHERAVSVLTHLFEQHPESSHIRYNLGIALYHLGDILGDEELLEKSIDHLEYLASLDKEDDNVLNDLGLACLTLADVHLVSFNSELADRHLQRGEHFFMQAVSAGNLEANYWLGCLHAVNEKIAASIHFLERAKAANRLPAAHLLLETAWLDNIKDTPQFKAFIAEISEE